MLSLMTLLLKSKRDVLLARQRARQVAGLFHFELSDQACIAAGTFAVTTQALRIWKSVQFHIQTADKSLHIFCKGSPELFRTLPRRKKQGNPASPESCMRLVKPLPVLAVEFTPEDLAWVVEQLNRQAHFNVFEEIQHQNQEMLALLHCLHAVQGQFRQLCGNQPASSAA
jgi:hypothetical protein